MLSDWRRLFFLVGGKNIEYFCGGADQRMAALGEYIAVAGSPQRRLFDSGDGGGSARISSTLRSSTSPTRRSKSSRMAMAGMARWFLLPPISPHSPYFSDALNRPAERSPLKFNSLNGERRLEPDQSVSTGSDR